MLARTHALLPRLGLFEGAGGAIASSRVPYDYDELIAAIAPRPTLIYAPACNRFADASGVATAATKAGAAWGTHRDAFAFTQPDAPSDFRDAEVAAAIEWVGSVVGATSYAYV